MNRQERVNHFDFIEFPADNVGSLNETKDFYKNVFDWSYKNWGDDYSDMQSRLNEVGPR